MGSSLEEEAKKFSIADYGVFACMLLVSTGIGVFYAYKDRKNKSSKDFLTSNRKLHWFPVAMSLMASFQSSVTILGYPAEMYLRGTQFWFVIISATIAAVTAAELFLPVYYNLNFTSVNKYLSLRYGSEKVRLASSITFLLGTVPYMGVVLYGPSLALSSVTHLSVSASILIIGLICTFYTSIGGIKAVVWTDTIQVFLMFGGLFAVMAKGFSLSGGIGNAFKAASDEGRIQFFNANIDLYATNNLWNAVIGMGVMWCANYCTTQTEVQRYCNVESQKKARLAIYVNLVGVILIISCACLSGIALFSYYNHCDPLKRGAITRSDQLMPYFVMETLSDYPGVPGLFVSCVFSASLSTLSSGFNALAAVTWDDFLSHTSIKHQSESRIKTMSKLIAASYGALAIAMAFLAAQFGSVLQAAISLAGALVGPLFGMYLLGMLCPFANTTGVMTGLFSGEAIAMWIVIGSIIFPKTPDQLDTFVDRCSIETNLTSSYYYSTTTTTTIGPLSSLTVTAKPLNNETTGLLSLYHIAFLLVPITGFVISLVVGFVVSLLTGGLNEAQNVNPKYLSKLAWVLCPASCVPLRKQGENNEQMSPVQSNKEHQNNHHLSEKAFTNGNSLMSLKNGHVIDIEIPSGMVDKTAL